MTHLWDAERIIQSPAALQIIQEQFPEIEGKNIEILGAGWDNTAFIVNDKWIFRFPRRQVAVKLLEEEWFFLPKLASYLSLPIPSPKWKGEPSSLFPWPFSGYPMLKGQTACAINLSESSRSQLAKPIGSFLKKLHSLPIENFARLPSFHHQSRIDGHLMNEKLKKNIEELQHLGFLENRQALERAISASQNFSVPHPFSIVHGDFYVRHLLLNDSKELTGIIDWGSVHVGDIANDLAIAHTFLPQSSHQHFRETYGYISENTWQLSRLRAILSGTYLILFGHYSQDFTIKREGLRTLKVICEPWSLANSKDVNISPNYGSCTI